MNESIYFVTQKEVEDMKSLIDALYLAGFDKTADKFNEIYNELIANKTSVDVLASTIS